MCEFYDIRPHSTKPGWFIVRDIQHLFELEFESGNYLKTARILDNGLLSDDVHRNVTVIRKMQEWLMENCRNLLGLKAGKD